MTWTRVVALCAVILLAGAVGVSALSNYLSAIIPEYWQLVLGVIFVVVTVVFKGGVAGALERAFGSRAGGRSRD